MKKISILVLLIGFFASCNPDSYLDVKPTGSKVPQTVEDFDKLLYDFQFFNTGVNLTYMDPDVLVPDAFFTVLPSDVARLQYKWDANPYFDPNLADNDWNYRYRKILTCNLIISEINDAKLGNRQESDRIRVKGEAYAQRAFEFFLLVNEYGPNYSVANLNKPGVPMPLEVNLTAHLGKSTVGEVYNQIDKDLATAENLLNGADPINVKANFRPGKASVFGLKATIALFKGDFAAAKDFSDKTLGLYSFLYDYTTLNNKTVGNAWSGINNADFVKTTDFKEVIWNRYHRNNYQTNMQFYSDDLLLLFDKTKDKRYLLFSSAKTYSGLNVSPYTTYARFDNQTEAGLTVPDMLLVGAESRVRTGDGAGALTQLNTLLQKRILNFVPYTTASVGNNAAILQLIKNERRKEFAATGKNWYDLKRYQAYGDAIPTFTRTVNGTVFTLAPGSDAYVVPVSQNVKSLNSNL